MNRRAFVSAAGVAILAGCLSGGAPAETADENGDEEPNEVGADVTDVDVVAEDLEVDDPEIEIDVRWNSRAQSAVDPGMSFEPDEGKKYVVIRAEITVEFDIEGPIDIRNSLLKLREDGVYLSPQNILTEDQSIGATVDSGATVKRWAVYAVDESTDEATLVADQDSQREEISVTFDHDPDLDIEMDEP